MTLSDFGWLSEIVNDRKHRAISLRQLSLFSSGVFSSIVTSSSHSHVVYRGCCCYRQRSQNFRVFVRNYPYSCANNVAIAKPANPCTVWVQKIVPFPWGFLKFFPKRLRIFNKNFTRLLLVHTYAKLQNFIQLSPTMTKLCRIKRDRPVNFYISPELVEGKLYRLHCKGRMATKFTRPQPTWLPCVGCNASGISQTSPKAKDHCRANKRSK